MKPSEVPDDLLSLYGRNYMGSSPKVAARRAMAAVIPEIERRVRERVAAEIEAERSGGTEQWDMAMDIAARIARGES